MQLDYTATIPQDIGSLLQLHQEGGLALHDPVIGSHSREYAVDGAQATGLSGHKAACVATRCQYC